jgi:DMSO/TMAO reductase YedYZ molybdopterin-dependent catalytic subunit
VNPVLRLLLDRTATKAEYQKEDISPFFWPNGKRPTSDEWKKLAANDFGDYRLKVFGLVERPVELSLKELEALGKKTQITLQHCIQGWSGIAEWGGLPFKALVDHVGVSPKARVAIFYSFGEGLEGGEYYDSHTMEHLLHPQTLLAYEMNFGPLPLEHGAPLRLRVENQLGFKMVKWIRAIELAEDYRHVYKGYGGYAADNEFFDSMADI